jgi:hypothetical protein
MTPPPEQATHYAHYQQPATRHHSLPNPTPLPGQEKLGQAWQPSFQHQSIPEQGSAPPQAYYASPPVQTTYAASPQGMQGLSDAYSGMKI